MGPISSILDNVALDLHCLIRRLEVLILKKWSVGGEECTNASLESDILQTRLR